MYTIYLRAPRTANRIRSDCISDGFRTFNAFTSRYRRKTVARSDGSTSNAHLGGNKNGQGVEIGRLQNKSDHKPGALSKATKSKRACFCSVFTVSRVFVHGANPTKYTSYLRENSEFISFFGVWTLRTFTGVGIRGLRH